MTHLIIIFLFFIKWIIYIIIFVGISADYYYWGFRIILYSVIQKYLFPSRPDKTHKSKNIPPVNLVHLGLCHLIYIIILYYCSHVYNTHNNIIGVRVYKATLFRPLRISDGQTDRRTLTRACTYYTGCDRKTWRKKKNDATQTYDKYCENYAVHIFSSAITVWMSR